MAVVVDAWEPRLGRQVEVAAQVAVQSISDVFLYGFIEHMELTTLR